MNEFRSDSKRKPTILYVATGVLLIPGCFAVILGITYTISGERVLSMMYFSLGLLLIFIGRRFWIRVGQRIKKAELASSLASSHDDSK